MAELRALAMAEKEGELRKLPSKRWAIVRPGRDPVEITSRDLFRVDAEGELKLTRMEFAPSDSGGE